MCLGRCLTDPRWSCSPCGRHHPHDSQRRRHADAAVQTAHIDLAHGRSRPRPGPLFSAQFLDRCTGWVSAHQAASCASEPPHVAAPTTGSDVPGGHVPVYPAASVLQVFVDGDQVHGDDDRHERSEETDDAVPLSSTAATTPSAAPTTAPPMASQRVPKHNAKDDQAAAPRFGWRWWRWRPAGRVLK